MLFISQPCEDYSISIDYDAIGVHAICRSSDIYQNACVYCQVSELDGDNGYYICQSPEIPCEGDDIYTNTNEEFVEGDYPIEEVLFSPEDPSLSICFHFVFQLVETLFDRISLYQSLYSEGEDADDDILQSGGEVAFDCNVEALFLQADVYTLFSPSYYVATF